MALIFKSHTVKDTNNNMGGDDAGSRQRAGSGAETKKKKKGLVRKLSKKLSAVTGSTPLPIGVKPTPDWPDTKVYRDGLESSEESEVDIPQPLEGMLSKYTNVMKGWQFRWFVLDPESGRLEYHEKEEQKKQKPRGYVHLAGAVICPSDEDSQTFSVNACNGEVFRLRALDAKERQHWVNRLRATAEYHNETQAQNYPPLPSSAGGGSSSVPPNRSGSNTSSSQMAPPPSGGSAALRDSGQSGSVDSLTGGVGSGGTSSAPPTPSVSQVNSSSGVVPTVQSQPNPTQQQNLQPARKSRQSKSPVPRFATGSPVVIKKRSHHKHRDTVGNRGELNINTAPTAAGPDDFAEVKDMLSRVQASQDTLTTQIEDLPSDGENLGPLDKEMLLLKATSSATLSCLEQCLSILQQQQLSTAGVTNASNNYGATIEWLDTKVSNGHAKPTTPISPAESFVSVASLPPALGKDAADCIAVDVITEQVNHEDEVEDECEYTDTDLEGVEEHKSIILHLLSQLKLGMDLTKVVLPTFILEKRSLLELFADCMAHPDLFLRVPELPTPEARMLGMVEWYLTSFHASRKGAIAKKPYNPIIGETFHCSWHTPQTPVNPTTVAGGKSAGEGGKLEAAAAAAGAAAGAATGGSSESQGENKKEEPVQMFFTAEQVSHHPPVSAFYFECPEKQVSMNASIYTKSKFMGMSIGVTMVGKVRCKLLSHNEEYEFSLPSAYARSILTVPWVELGDKISVNCPSTGYSAAITFHTKPFYGGKLHRLSSEVKRPNGEVVCKVSGEWNGQLEFAYTNGETKVIDTSKLITLRKRVRPIEQQGDFESRRLWQKVTSALKNGDINSATEHKRYLEERQRQGERHRRETKTKYPTKFFHLEENIWTFNNMLKPGQKDPSL